MNHPQKAPVPLPRHLELACNIVAHFEQSGAIGISSQAAELPDQKIAQLDASNVSALAFHEQGMRSKNTTFVFRESKLLDAINAEAQRAHDANYPEFTPYTKSEFAQALGFLRSALTHEHKRPQESHEVLGSQVGGQPGTVHIPPIVGRYEHIPDACSIHYTDGHHENLGVSAKDVRKQAEAAALRSSGVSIV